MIIISIIVFSNNFNDKEIKNDDEPNLSVSKIQPMENNDTKKILTEIINDDYLFRFWSTSEKIQNQSQQIQLLKLMHDHYREIHA